MYLCLMRHGKAEPYREGCEDSRRELAEKGKKQAVLMADTARYWWPDGKTALWASPSVRTCQTAAYLSKKIDFGEFHTHPALERGDLRAVYRDILCGAEADVVCIIGHSPYLGQWTETWTGTAVDFKTGSMALFDYDPYGGMYGSASLLLYVHPKGARLIKERRRH